MILFFPEKLRGKIGDPAARELSDLVKGKLTGVVLLPELRASLGVEACREPPVDSINLARKGIDMSIGVGDRLRRVWTNVTI
jgi:hypothetical protein